MSENNTPISSLEWDKKVVELQRKEAYELEADPLFFKYQRSEDGVTKAEWLAKVDEIRERFPMPPEPTQ